MRVDPKKEVSTKMPKESYKN